MSFAVHVDGLSNVRDLGGMPVAGGSIRPGRLLRADAPIGIPASGAATLRGLGLAKIIDLREPVERAHDPTDTASADGEWGSPLELPLFSGSVDLRQIRALDSLYLDVIAGCGERFVRVLAEIVEPTGTPALIHCSAGKDRTGLVVALLLDAIGAPRGEIVADYAATAAQMAGPAIEEVQRRALRAGIPEQHVAQALGSPPEVMEATLTHVDERYGGGAGYLLAHGAERDAIDLLRERLTS